MSDTPRTDDLYLAAYSDPMEKYLEMFNLARQLERELNAALKSLRSADDHHFYQGGVDGR